MVPDMAAALEQAVVRVVVEAAELVGEEDLAVVAVPVEVSEVGTAAASVVVVELVED